MRKHVLLYGLLGGVLIAVLKAIEYRWLVVERSVEIYGGFVAAVFASLGITPRELEVLELIAEGLSNREIAEQVYVSENTVKTHSSRVFDELDARGRVGQARSAVLTHWELPCGGSC